MMKKHWPDPELNKINLHKNCLSSSEFDIRLYSIRAQPREQDMLRSCFILLDWCCLFKIRFNFTQKIKDTWFVAVSLSLTNKQTLLHSANRRRPAGLLLAASIQWWERTGTCFTIVANKTPTLPKYGLEWAGSPLRPRKRKFSPLGPGRRRERVGGPAESDHRRKFVQRKKS